MKFSQDKRPALCLGRTKAQQETDWGCLAGEQLCGEGPGGSGGQLAKPEPAVNANSTLGCVRKSTARRWREAVIPLCSAFA